MTAPHKPSCVHVTNVTVVAPYQVCFDGTVYLPGDTFSAPGSSIAEDDYRTRVFPSPDTYGEGSPIPGKYGS